MTSLLIERDIQLAVVHNARHLGGYRTANGRETAASLIRTASLMRLEPDGLDRLRELGVRTIVDLRSRVERGRDLTPDASPAGIRTVAAAVFEQDASPVGTDSERFPGFARVYQRMLVSGRDAYRTLVETIARSDGSVLYHCAAGKDRTGVATALLLGLAGVSEEDIVDDYARSAELLAPMLKLWEPKMRERGVPPERVAAIMASKREDMEATLGHIRETWGSAEGYLADTGVSAADRDAARARLIA